MVRPTALLVLFVGIVVASDQCCYPPQFETTITQIKASFKDSQLVMTYGTLSVSYDTIGHQVRTSASSEVNGVPIEREIIKDYSNTNTMYIASAGGCMNISLGNSVIGATCPDPNEKLTSEYFGSPQNSLDFKIFENKTAVPSMLLATTQDCWPIFAAYAKPTGSSAYFEVMVFHDTSAGIKDSSVFAIPPSCRSE